jgi:hypothetical protein
LERGASLPVVATIMGWSPGTTAKMAKRYGHIGNDVQRAALDALLEPTPVNRGQSALKAQDRIDDRGTS